MRVRYRGLEARPGRGKGAKGAWYGSPGDAGEGHVAKLACEILGGAVEIVWAFRKAFRDDDAKSGHYSTLARARSLVHTEGHRQQEIQKRTCDRQDN